MTGNAFVYSPLFQKYKFSQDHPFNQVRVELTLDLLSSMNAISKTDLLAPREATEEELSLVHDKGFINAVKKAGKGELPNEEAGNYGIGTEDTPIFEGMHEASSLLVGGTLEAVDYVMSGKGKHAVNLAGGLHHGFRGKASGFCVYNDSSVAMRYIQKKYQARVLYVDTDAHHGDGVQWTFYDDSDICTLSIHETGRYLFPGTGNVSERGQGTGYGFSFNIPLDAFTEDESWLNAYRSAFKDVVEYFKPDVIFTQNGVDAHYYDPLTHLSATIDIYKEIPKLAHELAHQYCDGRWIAVGGGGYDIWRVVPRAWSFIWLVMNELSIPSAVPEDWLQKWQKKSPVTLPQSFEDPKNMYKPIPRKQEIEEKNTQTVERALQFIGQNSANSRSN
ncbi:acetoin utilization protein AcuC [Metabacillus sp. RGM 3146]|uniref:acetoin utilization protein AcuC n=1 Tax=Metabacillus sp. RGM 3146 TaxID=3401092 RepID=UPI003B9B407C